ncbi:hypothetical protein VUR80DRAFT_556 [Thermomyces stellatus]
MRLTSWCFAVGGNGLRSEQGRTTQANRALHSPPSSTGPSSTGSSATSSPGSAISSLSYTCGSFAAPGSIPVYVSPSHV